MIRGILLSLCLFIFGAVQAHAAPFCGRLLGANKPQIGTKAESAKLLAQLEDFWSEELKKLGVQFHPATLVLFEGAVLTACGFAVSQIGPFYCLTDRKIYLDLKFLDKARAKHGLSGDATRAYVLAHEYGHHIVNLVGALPKILAAYENPTYGNQISVRNELTADALAGFFAAHLKKIGIMSWTDLQDAANATLQIGDDVLRTRALDKSCFNHGSGLQRRDWFFKGLRAKSFKDINAFTDRDLLSEFPKEIHPMIQTLYSFGQ